jgi:hypothetical protein
VLVLPQARLVVLLTPKTGSQSLAHALAPHALDPGALPMVTGAEGRHVGAAAYARHHAAQVADLLGEAPRTLAVMRAPLDRLGSWFRYRTRPGIADPARATTGMTFADFIAATLAPDPPPFARIGRQDRFLGVAGQGPPVDLIADYAQLHRLAAFLSGALGVPLRLPRHNASPGDPPDLSLLPDLSARLRADRAGEWALYDRVTAAGMLDTATLSSSAR